MITLIGAAGSGKTTLGTTLAEGLVDHGAALAVLDAKGSGALARRCRELAERHDRSFALVSLEPFGEERRLVGELMTDRMRKWLDEPHPALVGQTPCEAASGERRAEVVRLVRGIENGAERARRRGEAAAELSWLRGELGVADELAA